MLLILETSEYFWKTNTNVSGDNIMTLKRYNTSIIKRLRLLMECARRGNTSHSWMQEKLVYWKTFSAQEFPMLETFAY